MRKSPRTNGRGMRRGRRHAGAGDAAEHRAAVMAVRGAAAKVRAAGADRGAVLGSAGVPAGLGAARGVHPGVYAHRCANRDQRSGVSVIGLMIRQTEQPVTNKSATSTSRSLQWQDVSITHRVPTPVGKTKPCRTLGQMLGPACA